MSATRPALLALMTAGLLLCSRDSAAQSAQAEPPAGSDASTRVLFLNSYHQGYEWSDSITTGIMSVFSQIAPNVGIYIEYLDSKHFPFTAERQQATTKALQEKFKPDFFDLIITSDDRAFTFMKESRDALFPETPVVFTGVNFLDEAVTPLPPGFAGVVESFDYKGIAAMARTLFPERRKAWIIVDNSITGDNIVKAAAALFPIDDLSVDFLSGRTLSHAELLTRLSMIGDDSIVIIASWQRDRTNRYLTVTEAFESIVSATSAPVFVVLRTPPSIGMAGGSAVSGIHQGRMAARIALEILGGKPPAEIPVMRDSVHDRMLNKPVLEDRWNIRWNELPPEIRSIPATFPLERNYHLPRELVLTTQEIEFIRSRPEIHAVLRDAPPLMIPGSPPSGMVVDLLTEISALNGLAITIDELKHFQDGNPQSMDSTEVQNRADGRGNSRVIHILAAKGSNLDESWILTSPYTRLHTVIFSRDDQAYIGGIDSLAGLKAGVVSGSGIEAILKDEHPDVRVVSYQSAREGILALENGEIDSWVGFLSTGLWLKKELGLAGISVAAPTGLPPQPISFAIPKSEKILADILSKSIQALPPDHGEMLKDGYMDRLIIRQGWSTDSVLKMLLAVAVAFLVVVTVFAVRIRASRQETFKREQNLRVTLDSIADAVIVTDPGLNITRMNPVAEALTGWGRNDAIGRHVAAVMRLADPDTGEPMPNPAEDVICGAAPEQRRADLASLISRGNRTCLIESSASVVGGSGDTCQGTVIVFRDVTQKQLFQDQIQHSRKMEAIGQLAGGVAHDFNNMLAAIQGYAELLNRRAAPDSPEQKFCQNIFNATERAAGLTSKLLAFARKGKALSTPIDVHESIRNALGLLERSLDKSIVITSRLDAQNSMVVGDPSQIQSAILNLCINARDAMPNGGRLEVFTDNLVLSEIDCRSSEFKILPGEYVGIHVRDTGTGIDPKTLSHIFEPFFTTKEVGRGTGLGLAAVHGAIVEHGGAIKVYTEIGRGTQFNIYLPVSHDDAYRPPEEYRTTIPHEGLVLIVEDESIISSMAETMLLEAGFEVVTAENGRIGVQKFRENLDRLRLVIIDVIMPEMDGMTALKAMREISPTMPFIVASGFSFDHRRDEFIRAGARSFLAKPFRNSELIKAVDDCLMYSEQIPRQ
ncbi:MAG TPA: response regulator [Myxococcota bacterium]|nr:response regulator [Myxococcota bacterium]HOH76995.1 response regulator [Myxococcota bacterium]